MGIVPINERKTLYIKIVESPVGGYRGTTKNGIITKGQTTIDTSVNGYIFVREDGTEIKSPTINSMSVSGGENSVNVTLDVDYKNGATENKCYYSIYNGGKWGNYIEGNIENNKCTFEVLPHKNYTIRTYVVDNRGVSSENFEITGKASNEIPKPIIKILKPDSEEEFAENDPMTFEYKGDIWYPYGTRIDIIYPENMTNLSGVYTLKYTFGSYTNSNSWGASAGGNNSMTATQTATYYARIEDQAGEVVEANPITVHIMPIDINGFANQSNYYNYCTGQIFPVIATGTQNGALYGTDIYRYDSCIGKAAMHMGLVNEGETYRGYIKILEDMEPFFGANTRNGITSFESSSTFAYIFVTEDGETIEPKGEITSGIIDDTGITFSYDYTECEDKGPYEYDGKTWYPYGTKLTINFSGEGTYWYCYYNGTETKWYTLSSGNSVTLTITNHDNIIARIVDTSSNKEIHRKAERINIMLPSSQYWYTIPGIYLVKVNGNIGDNEVTYGTDTYYIGGSIKKAAVHYGLVKKDESMEKIIYVRVVKSYLARNSKVYRSFTSSTRNGVGSRYTIVNGSSSYEVAYRYFEFVNKYGNPIPAFNKENNDVTLFEYKVMPTNSGYPCFINDGTSIIPENEVTNNGVLTQSYIELDLTNYKPSDTVKITLDVNLGFKPNTNHYGTINIDRVKDSRNNTYSYGYLIKADGTVENGTKESDNIYSKRVAGGAKYRIYFGYKNNNAEDGTMRINSLNVEKVENDIKITPKDTTIEPFIDKEGIAWYPWNTTFIISKSNDYVYYTVNSIDSVNGIYSTNKQEITLVKPSTYKFGYANEYSINEHNQEEITLNIMPYLDGNDYGHFDNVNVGKIYPVKVKRITGYSIYGIEKYEYRSSINMAATHMGLLDDKEEKYVYIKIVSSPEGGYKSTIKNGITSYAIKDSKNNGFVFVKEDGTEILEPIINSGTTTIGEENTILVTVDAIGKNDTTVEKYYYSIDNGEYTEETNNTYTFTVENPNSIHTIRMYVRDSNGAISQTKEILTSATNGAPTFTLTDSEGNPIPEENIVHYDNKEWYPYGTKLTINFAEDMTNLNGYYGYIDERTGEKSYWYNNSNNKTYAPQLYYSITYMAKLKDTRTSKETEDVSKTVYIMPNGANGAAYYYQYLGNIYPVRVTGTTSSGVWGTDTYSYDSNVNKAATHMGLVKEGETKTVFIKIVKSPVGGYRGSTRNGINTSDYSSSNNGFIFVDENGNEIIRPKVDALIVQPEDSAITVTANASSNSGEIKEYYYSIDDGEYTKSTENHYAFKNITKSGEHSIKVYVKDSNGDESAVKEIKGRKKIPTPTFNFNQEPITYNGEKWYPYNTQITIKYNDEPNYLTSLMGYYRTINVHTKARSNWTNTNYSTITSSGLTESMTYEAYAYETTVGEGEHIREKINIMVNPDGLQRNYHQYGSGNVYPVQVTGTTYGTIYGTDTYSYNSNISKAATHAGLVNVDETKVVYIKIVPCPEGGYIGSTQNGIASSSYTNAIVGYTFIK